MKKITLLFFVVLVTLVVRAQSWSELGGVNSLSPNYSINSICSDVSGNIYATGSFTNVSGNYYVAKYNGTSWNELGGLNGLSANNIVNSICCDKTGNIYVAGDFTNASGKRYVAKYNGTTWSELGGLNALSANNTINSICCDTSGNVYAAGNFTNVSAKRYVAKWNGVNWGELGGLNGLSANGSITVICNDKSGNIYATGNFTNLNFFAKYNGGSWSAVAVPSSSLGGALSLCNDTSANNIYAAGGFTMNYGAGFKYVAKTNGTSWTAVGGNTLGACCGISALCCDKNGNVYAAGWFVNGASKRYVAKWNGVSWSELGGYNILAANNNIYSLCSDTSNNIYAAGDFTNANGNRYVAKYGCVTPYIAIQASSNPVCPNNNLSFSTSITNGGSIPNYQWKKNGVIIVGANSSSYSYVPIHQDTISCVLTANNLCQTSSTAISNSCIVHFKTNSAHTFSANICPNGFYLFHNNQLNTTGNYFDTLTNYQGCDSFLTLQLTVLPNDTSLINQNICSNQTYSFNGSILNSSGVYFDTLQNYLGCDSIISLHLNVLHTSTNTFNQSICNNQTYNFFGHIINTTGNYKDTLQNYLGCDSVITLHLTIHNSTSSSSNQSICSNQNYTFHNHALNTTGVYFDTLINHTGCDSLITLHLTVLNTSTFSYNQNICSNQTYTFNNHVLNLAGTYFDTLTNYQGCDSFLTLHLSVLNISSSTSYASICNGTSYLFNGNSYSIAGTYIAHLTNYLGCDSVATLFLSILPTSSSITNYTSCNNQPYTFNGVTYNATGTYATHLINYLGCDSTATLNLTMSNSIIPTVSIIATSPINICYGTSISFKFISSNSGSFPLYDVYINHTNIGSTMYDTLSIPGLLNGDSIQVLMHSNSTCSSQNIALSNVIVVTVDSMFTPSVILNSNPNGTINAGTNITFTAVAMYGGSSPQFNFKVNLVSVQNSTSNTYNTNGLNNGDKVSCELTANNTCQTSSTATSNSITIFVKPTGIDDVQTKNNFVGDIYPNPTLTGGFTLSVQSNEIGKAQLQICNYMGQIILDENVQLNNSNLWHLDLSKYSSGTYLVTLKTSLGNFVERLMVVK